MSKPMNNPRNDRLKREYLVWLKQANQRAAGTVEQARHALDRFEAYTRFKDFGTFNKEQALGFKQALAATLGQRSGKPISIATVHHTLQAIKNFLIWLHGQPGFRRKIAPADVAYLSVTKGEERQARTSSPKTFASYEQFRSALFAMPAGTEVERRDRALMALLLMTGMRDAAITGLKIGDVDPDKSYLFQDPRHAHTKFSKAIDTFFLPVGEDVIAIFTDWFGFLKSEKGFGPSDPVFPKTANLGEQAFGVRGFGREHWANAGPVRKCFREAFARIGLTFTKPHTIRDTLTQLGYSRGWTPEQMKALSQNMGHDSPLTTYNSYGQLSRERQGEIILGLSQEPAGTNVNEMDLEELVALLAAKVKAGKS
jgi:integrase